MSQFAAQVDAHKYPPKDKHAVIFDTFHNLKKDEMMLVEYEDQFEWEYLEQGPEVWRVAITKK